MSFAFTDMPNRYTDRLPLFTEKFPHVADALRKKKTDPTLRVGSLDAGCYRQVDLLFKEDGFSARLVLKRDNGYNDWDNEFYSGSRSYGGCEQEVAFHKAARKKAPALARKHLPKILAHGEGWLIMEQVETRCVGIESPSDIDAAFHEKGLWCDDLHRGNIGRHPVTGHTVILDAGHCEFQET